jgi:sulfite reductase (NADPH) hemoprotein beta-component
MNGVYLQLHAYMLRVAIPYGTLSSQQLRMLAHIARTYDRGYGHFTTRQNMQFHWPALADIPAALADLASV